MKLHLDASVQVYGNCKNFKVTHFYHSLVPV